MDVDTRTLPEHLSNFLEDSSFFQPGGGSREKHEYDTGHVVQATFLCDVEGGGSLSDLFNRRRIQSGGCYTWCVCERERETHEKDGEDR